MRKLLQKPESIHNLRIPHKKILGQRTTGGVLLIDFGDLPPASHPSARPYFPKVYEDRRLVPTFENRWFWESSMIRL